MCNDLLINTLSIFAIILVGLLIGFIVAMLAALWQDEEDYDWTGGGYAEANRRLRKVYCDDNGNPVA